MSRNVEDPHDLYEQKLTEIGKALGFRTKGKETSVGWLDCVWRLEGSNRFVKSEEHYVSRYGLPIVAFEVVYSEKDKRLRGSLLNMIFAKPSLAVFVFLKRTRQQDYPSEDVDRTVRYVENLCQEVAGLIRTEIWYEEDVDKLYSEVVGAPAHTL